MTRKDYILIAKVFNQTRVEYEGYEYSVNAVDVTASYLATEIANDNPRFDRDHFLAVVRGECDLNSRPGRR